MTDAVYKPSPRPFRPTDINDAPFISIDVGQKTGIVLGHFLSVEPYVFFNGKATLNILTGNAVQNLRDILASHAQTILVEYPVTNRISAGAEYTIECKMWWVHFINTLQQEHGSDVIEMKPSFWKPLAKTNGLDFRMLDRKHGTDCILNVTTHEQDAAKMAWVYSRYIRLKDKNKTLSP